MNDIKRLVPPLAPCHACGTEYVGCRCTHCDAENPTFTAIKNISREQEERLMGAVNCAGHVC